MKVVTYMSETLPCPEYLSTELVKQFDLLVSQLSVLTSTLDEERPEHWVPLNDQESKVGMKPLDKAKQFYQDLWYIDGQDGRETRSCFGLLAVSENIIQLAEGVNETKANLQKAVQLIQKEFKQNWPMLHEDLNCRNPDVRDAMQFNRLARVHLKQCYRNIPILSGTPDKVGFNWYKSGRSIKRISVKDAMNALSKLNMEAPHIQLQMKQLAYLDSNTPLAKVQTLAPIMRANIVYKDEIGKQIHTRRQAMNVSLPLLFPVESKKGFPNHNQPELNPPEQRMRMDRSDAKIDAEPFLPSIRVHRYILE